MRKTTWALLGFLIVLVGMLMGYQTGVPFKGRMLQFLPPGEGV